MKGLEYRGVSSIDGPLVFIENISDVAFDDLVEITSPDGETRLGQVLDVTATTAVVQVFGGTENLSQRDTKTRFLGESLRIPVSRDMLGRVFDGLARPKDGLPAPLTAERRDVNGMPVNPYAREYPRDFIQTGISSIDLMNTLVRGQKLPIFSGNGLPHNRMAAQIARQAKLLNENVDFAIVFAAMGVKYDVARFFIDSFEKSGVLHNVAMFLSLADDPSVADLDESQIRSLTEPKMFDGECYDSLTPEQMAKYEEKFHDPEIFVRMGKGIAAIPVPGEVLEQKTGLSELKQDSKREEAVR